MGRSTAGRAARYSKHMADVIDLHKNYFKYGTGHRIGPVWS